MSRVALCSVPIGTTHLFKSSLNRFSWRARKTILSPALMSPDTVHKRIATLRGSIRRVLQNLSSPNSCCSASRDRPSCRRSRTPLQSSPDCCQRRDRDHSRVNAIPPGSHLVASMSRLAGRDADRSVARSPDQCRLRWADRQRHRPAPWRPPPGQHRTSRGAAVFSSSPRWRSQILSSGGTAAPRSLVSISRIRSATARNCCAVARCCGSGSGCARVGGGRYLRR